MRLEYFQLIDRIIDLNLNDLTIRVEANVPTDSTIFEGHFPGRPLMPGVLMIEAAAQLCSIQYKSRTNEPRFLGFSRCDDVSFRGQVVPGDTLYLLGKEVDFRARRFIAACQGMVDDKIVFEATITGMVI